VKRPPPEYDALARVAILDLLQREHALVWLEVEAKLAERPHPQAPKGINPHHLTNARTALLKENVIHQLTQLTRGGGEVAVFVPTDQRGKKTAVEHAAARKRLLQARYLSWATGSGRRPNLIGEAGERVARASLRAVLGHNPANPSGRDVPHLFGQPIPGGSLDDAAHITAFSEDQYPRLVTTLIEVKNVRHWVYPSSTELYQLLEKAARIQIAHPSQLIVPVFICRRAQYTTFRMAKDLGFLVLDTVEQPILPHSELDPEHLAEVQNELGYNLVPTVDAHPKLTNAFRETLPKIGVRIASRWSITAPGLASLYASLRLGYSYSGMQELREQAKRILGISATW
jgi:hypothetical protein